MKTITLQQLIEAHACDDQVAQFVELFGAAVDVTPETCMQVAHVFDWIWARDHLLHSAAQHELCRQRQNAARKRFVTTDLKMEEPPHPQAKAAIAEYRRSLAHAFAIAYQLQ